MKTFVLFAAAAWFASAVYAEDEQAKDPTHFDFVDNVLNENPETIDKVDFPYTREGDDKQCIQHSRPAQGIWVLTDGGKLAPFDYCLYAFYDDDSCQGDVSEALPANATMAGGFGMNFKEASKSSVIRKGWCPPEKPKLVPTEEIPGSA